MLTVNKALIPIRRQAGAPICIVGRPRQKTRRFSSGYKAGGPARGDRARSANQDDTPSMPAPANTIPSMSATDWALLLILSVLWGGSFYFAKIAVAEIPPLTLA